jgi:hypothetical protein
MVQAGLGKRGDKLLKLPEQKKLEAWLKRKEPLPTKVQTLSSNPINEGN